MSNNYECSFRTSANTTYLTSCLTEFQEYANLSFPSQSHYSLRVLYIPVADFVLVVDAHR